MVPLCDIEGVLVINHLAGGERSVCAVEGIDWISIINWCAAGVGLLYVWLELRASMWLWPVGIVLPLLYIYVSWHDQVYGNVLVNIYYIIACIWGWREWLKHRRTEGSKEKRITYLPRKLWGTLISITLLLVLVFAPLLRHYMDSPFPWGDAVATATSFVGMWLLGKKYMENWYCWILSNAILSMLFFIQNNIPIGIFYVVYTAIAVMGYFNWRKLMRQQSYAD